MTTIRPVRDPLYLSSASLIFRLDATDLDFSDHISEARVNPTPGSDDWISVNGKPVGGEDSYTLTLSLVQDMDHESFMWFLWDNAGATVPVTVTPAASASSLVGEVLLKAASIGGKADKKPKESQVTLTFAGKPTRLAKPTPDPEGEEG